MTYYKFDSENIVSQLNQLPPLHCVAFGASCCERLLPNYRKFTEVEGWGDFNILRKALDEIWNFVLGENHSKCFLQKLMDQCDQVIPDADDFNSIYTSFAIDAGGSIFETLHYCVDFNPEHLADVASFARDTVDMFIQERDNMDYSDPDFEETILRDELMIREIKHQLEDLDLLKVSNKLNPEFIATLRQSSTYGGRSNINCV